MRFAAGLTVTGILSFILLEALKIIMVPVTGWVIGLLAILIKIVLIGFFVIVVGIVIAIGVYFYKRQQGSAVEV